MCIKQLLFAFLLKNIKQKTNKYSQQNSFVLFSIS